MTNKHHDAIEKIEQMRNLLAFLLVGTFVGSIVMFTFRPFPETNKEIIIYMVGQLSGMATTVLGFFFVNKVGADALDAKRADNTGKAMDAIVAASGATSPTEPQEVIVTNTAAEPVPTTQGKKP